MKLAYIGEAETMETLGIDWRTKKPFTVGIQLNREHPEMQKTLEEAEQVKKDSLSEVAVKNDPDLEKLFDSFYKGNKPPTQ